MNNMNIKLKRPRLLILGCGDVGMRLLPLVRERFRVFAVTSDPQRRAELRAAGAVPVVADLDRPATLKRLAGLAHYVAHLAPPQSDGLLDRRTRHLCAILPEGARMVYVSTSGVYGDCAGALIDETRTVAPHNARAQRRVDAERVLRAWAARRGASVAILRVPGIYARERLPLRRLEQGTAALLPSDDVYTNHIHADDLARIAALALFRGLPGRIYHAVDDTHMKMADYFTPLLMHSTCRVRPAWRASNWPPRSRPCCCRLCQSRAVCATRASRRNWGCACAIRRWRRPWPRWRW